MQKSVTIPQFEKELRSLYSELHVIHERIGKLMTDVGEDARTYEWRTLHLVMKSTGLAGDTLYDGFNLGGQNSQSAWAGGERTIYGWMTYHPEDDED